MILASNLNLISFKYPKKSIISLLENTYKTNNYILSGILSHKHLNNKNGNILRLKKIIVRFLLFMFYKK